MKPNWYPVNPFPRPGRNRDMWDQATLAMAKAIMEQVEDSLCRVFDGSGSYHYAMGPMTLERLKREVLGPCTDTCGADEMGICKGEPTCPDYRP